MNYVFYALVAFCVVLTAVSCYRIYRNGDEELSLPVKLQRIELEIARLLFWMVIFGTIGSKTSMNIMSNVSALLAAIVSMRILYGSFKLGDRKLFDGAARVMFGIVAIYVLCYFLDYFHMF